MPKIKTEPYLRLELAIDKKVISDYKLNDIVYNSHKIKHPIFHVVVGDDDGQPFEFPFTFPPLFIKHSEEYLNEFMNLYKEISVDIDEKHHDNILFLAYTYFTENEKKRQNIFAEDQLRMRGKLLLEMIKVPIPKLNETNIYHAFDDEPYLYPDEVRDYILAYLGLCSGLHEATFLTDPLDSESKIDFSKVDDDLWIKLTRHIQKDRHVSIVIEERKSKKDYTIERRYLTISKDIRLKLQPTVTGKVKSGFKTEDVYHNTKLLQVLLKELYEEQKSCKSDLYYAIMNHDFIIDTKFWNLSAAVGKYDRMAPHYSNLEALHDALIEYFQEHQLLCNKSKALKNQERSNFILQYFLLLDIKTSPIERCKSTTPICEIKKSLSEYRNSKTSKHATKAIADMFRNNRRTGKYKATKKGQSQYIFYPKFDRNILHISKLDNRIVAILKC